MPELNDEEHENILDNEAAKKLIAERAVERAVADGMTLAEAEQLYGYKPPVQADEVRREIERERT
jgi:hypothetical protein